VPALRKDRTFRSLRERRAATPFTSTSSTSGCGVWSGMVAFPRSPPTLGPLGQFVPPVQLRSEDSSFDAVGAGVSLRRPQEVYNSLRSEVRESV